MSASVRSGGIDLGRILAIVSVVGIHTFGYAATVPAVGETYARVMVMAVFRWSVPFLFLVSGYLHAIKGEVAESTSWLWRRVYRLGVLYLAWSAIYRLISLAGTGRAYSLGQLRLDLMYGDAGSHLWFLGALIQITVLTWLARRYLREVDVMLPTALGLFTIQLGIAAFGAQLPGLLGEYLVEHWFGTPVFWWVFYLLGFSAVNGVVSRCKPRPAVLVAVIVAGALLAVARFTPLAQIGPALVRSVFSSVSYHVGYSVVAVAAGLLAVRATWPSTRMLASLGGVALGVYLLHFYVLQRWIDVVAPERWGGLAPLWPVITVFVVAVVSAALAWSLSRVPWVRGLVKTS